MEWIFGLFFGVVIVCLGVICARRTINTKAEIIADERMADFLENVEIKNVKNCAVEGMNLSALRRMIKKDGKIFIDGFHYRDIVIFALENKHTFLDAGFNIESHPHDGPAMLLTSDIVISLNSNI